MKKKKLLVFIAVFAAFAFFLAIKAYLFFTAKPNIAVNYVAEWNKISKPQNYDPCQNACFDYEKAGTCSVKMPEIMQYYGKPAWPDWPGDMNDGQLKILKDWLAENTQAFDYFKQGSQKPYHWFEAPEEKINVWKVTFPALPELRLMAVAFNWRAKSSRFFQTLSADQGLFTAAARYCRA
jgi:hypothetical protein